MRHFDWAGVRRTALACLLLLPASTLLGPGAGKAAATVAQLQQGGLAVQQPQVVSAKLWIEPRAAGLDQTPGDRAEPVLVAAAPKGSSQPGSKSKPPHAGPKSELPQQSGGAKGGGGAGLPENPKPGSKAPVLKPGAKSEPPGQAGGSKPGGASKATGKAVEMTVGAYLLPDLRVVQIGVHKLNNTKLRIEVENAGDGSSKPTVLDVTSTEKKTGKVKKTTAKVAALLPKASAWITVDNGVPVTMLKKVDVRVDWQNQVKESNDQNNRAVRYF